MPILRLARTVLAAAVCLLICPAALSAADDRGAERYDGVLANEHLAIKFSNFASGCTAYTISAVSAGPRPMGVVRPFARVVYLSRRGERKEVEFQPILESQTDSRQQAAAVLAVQATGDDGTRWTFRARFTLAAAEHFARIEYSLSADRRVRLLHFRGPTLLAGEGSFGGTKDQALLPGLEYLLAGERSSSMLDVTSEGYLRLVPHPYKITVPLMAVQREGLAVGLMWDANQVWDGRHHNLAAIFASPNFVDEDDNHLLALGLPPFPWAPENEWIAEKPYSLRPGRPLTLRFEILVQPVEQVIDTIDTWLALRGLPPVPQPPRPLSAQIGLSLRALLDTLWYDDETGYGWKPWTEHKSQPRLDPQLNLLLALGGPLAGDHRLSERAAARVAEVNSRGGWAAGTGNLDYAYRFGGILPSVHMARGGMLASIRGQKPDGSWRFEPEPGRELLGVLIESLGERGEAAVGLTAGPAARLLRFARITGDQEVEAAGLLATDFMQPFVRPQASQVWECPVHAPDILASAQAADAHLEAYRITGDPEHLRRAVYWARTGLPFLYLWHAPDRKIMSYASIPIFGASIFTWPWFGRPVQWNGLAYASVLRRLAEYDGSHDWTNIADGITAAAAQMQASRGPQVGNYPDAYYVVDGVTMSGPWLRPDGLLPNLLAQAERNPGVDTTIVRTERGRLHISSAAAIADAAAIEADAKVTFGVGDPAPGTLAVVTVAGLDDAPDTVTYSAKAWPQYEPDALKDNEGWAFQDGVLAIQAKSAGRVIATYGTLAFRLPPAPVAAPLHVDLSPESAVAGEDFVLSVTIRNDSQVDLSGTDIEVSLSAPEGWTTVAAQRINAVGLPAGGTLVADVPVRAPYAAAGGYGWLVAEVEAKPADAAEALTGRGAVGIKMLSPLEVQAGMPSTIMRGAIATRLGIPVQLANLRDAPLEGTLSIIPRADWPREDPVAFTLGPKEQATVTVPVAAPPDVGPGRYRGDLIVAIDGEAMRPIQTDIFVPTPCPRIERRVEIDGDLREWRGRDPIRLGGPGEGDEEARRARADFSSTTYLGWDDQYFYLASQVRDDVFSEPYRGSDIWQGDSVQFAIDPLLDGGEVYHEDDYEYGVALTVRGVETWRWAGSPGEPGPAPRIRAAVIRRWRRTIYEVAVPWRLLAPLAPEAGRAFGMSLLFNDDDGAGRSFHAWGAGIALRKRPKLFEKVLLTE